MALTLLSVGTPMLLMGDEVRRTQQGNNNAYCLDSDVTWFNWDLCRTNIDLLRFVQELIRLRLHFDHATTGDAIPLEDYLCTAQIKWHGTALDKPDWGRDSHAIAVSLHNYALNNIRYIAVNSFWKNLTFQLPPLPTPSSRWIRMIDTSLPSPEDIACVDQGSLVAGSSYIVNPRSITMLHFAPLRD